MKKPIKRKEPDYKHRIAMLIDDNEMDNFINQKIIEGTSFAKNIYVNTNGISALEFLKNILTISNMAEDRIPDIIFIDINMPAMDGFQFIDELGRLSEKIKKKIKLVLLTSSANTDDKIRSSKYSSKITFINKPLTEISLMTIC